MPGPAAPAASALGRPSAGAGVAAVALLAVAATALHFLRDRRLPRDPGLYWAELPPVDAALDAGDPAAAMAALARPGGWLVVGVALAARLVPGPVLFEALSVAAIGAVVASAGALGGQVGGRRGAWTGALVAAGMPLVVVIGRLPWIHLYEAALLGPLLALLARDGGRGAPHRVAAAALLGLALASLRHSGLVWLVCCLPLLRGRGWGLLVPWGLGALPTAAALPAYLGAKAAARAGYAARLPGLLPQLASLVGAGPGLAAVLGLVGRARARRSPAGAGAGAPGDRLDAVAGLLAAATLAMWALFQAGLDNFCPLVFALVVGAGRGAGRGRVAVAAAGAAALGLQSAWPGGADRLDDLRRPWTGPGPEAVRALITAACPAGPCRLGASSSLFHPHGEEPGRLELWMLGMADTTLTDLRQGGRDLLRARPDGVLDWECRRTGAAWRQRFPQSDRWQRYAARRLEMGPAWVVPFDADCQLVLWTPGGALAGPTPAAGAPPPGRERAPGPPVSAPPPPPGSP